MRRVGWLAASAVGALVLGAARSAGAVVVTATFTGSVTQSVTDLTFGAYDLVGMTYTARYTYDSLVGTDQLYAPGSGYFDHTLGGYYANSPLLAFSLTINGHTDAVDWLTFPSRYSLVERTSNPAVPFGSLDVDAQGSRVVASPGGGQATDFMQFGSTFTATTPIGSDMGATWNPTTALSGNSGFLRQVQNAGQGYDQAYLIRGTVTSAGVTSASVTAGAPEPGAWALMITGFGLAGGALRRRRATASA